MWSCSEADTNDDIRDLIAIHVACCYSHTTKKIRIESKKT